MPKQNVVDVLNSGLNTLAFDVRVFFHVCSNGQIGLLDNYSIGKATRLRDMLRGEDETVKEAQEKIVEELNEELVKLEKLVKADPFSSTFPGNSLYEQVNSRTSSVAKVDETIQQIDESYKKIKELYNKMHPSLKTLELSGQKRGQKLSDLFKDIDNALKPESKFRKLLRTVVKAVTLGKAALKQSAINMTKDVVQKVHNKTRQSNSRTK